MKTCNKCNILKPLEQFYKNKKSRDGHRGDCKECKRAISALIPLEEKRRWKWKSAYGITPEQYTILLQVQLGLCAICKQPERDGTNLSVDHDHETGKIRGLLCKHCNLSLGYAHDNPATLRAAAEYLERIPK